jgi:hypothetical protein
VLKKLGQPNCWIDPDKKTTVIGIHTLIGTTSSYLTWEIKKGPETAGTLIQWSAIKTCAAENFNLVFLDFCYSQEDADKKEANLPDILNY